MTPKSRPDPRAPTDADMYRIAGKHQPVHRPESHQKQVCTFDNNTWPCDTRKVLDFIDQHAEARSSHSDVSADEVERLRAALREYLALDDELAGDYEGWVERRPDPWKQGEPIEKLTAQHADFDATATRWRELRDLVARAALREAK